MRNIKCKNTSPAFTSVQPNHFLGINTTYVISLTNVCLKTNVRCINPNKFYIFHGLMGSETYAWNLYLLIFSKKHTQEKTTTTTTAKQEQNAEKMKYLTHVSVPWRLVDNAATFFFWNLPLILLITYPSFLWVCFKVFPLTSDKYSH